MIRAVCFDLFFTLADPHTHLEPLTWTPLGMTQEEWGKYFWNAEFADDRGLGVIQTEAELQKRLFSMMPFAVPEETQAEVMRQHKDRMRLALCDVRLQVMQMLRGLKQRGLKLGLISNADVIDKAAWQDSPMAPFFDDVIFSCDVKMVKPDAAIYRLSLQHLGMQPQEALFVGDGGSEEHRGAKAIGMHTARAEYLMRYRGKQKKLIAPFADYVLAQPQDLCAILDLLAMGKGNVINYCHAEEDRYYVYLLCCADDSLYCGYTPMLYSRLCTHLRGKGAKYTRSRLPAQLVWCEEFLDKHSAMAREAAIKHLSRQEKLQLIKKDPEMTNEI